MPSQALSSIEVTQDDYDIDPFESDTASDDESSANEGIPDPEAASAAAATDAEATASPSPQPDAISPVTETISQPISLPSRKRKRQPATTERPPQRLQFTQEMTETIMNLFLDCKQQGMFNSAKKKDYTAAWDHVTVEMKDRYPRFAALFTRKSITDKYTNELRRYRTLIDFLSRSGTSWNAEQRLPEGSDENWEIFFAQNNTNTRRVNWLRTQPIGDRDVYEEVFWRERPSGGYMAEAGETAINEEEQESEAIETSEASQPLPARLSARQRRRLQFDPDENSSLPDEVSDRSLFQTPVSSRKRSKPSETPSDIQNLSQSLQSIANSMAASVDSTEIRTALSDALQTFAVDLAAEEVMRVTNKLKDPLEALVWNTLSAEQKRGYIQLWRKA